MRIVSFPVTLLQGGMKCTLHVGEVHTETKGRY
jgi:hypothetical protein